MTVSRSCGRFEELGEGHFLTDLVDRNALDSLVRFCKPEKAIFSIRVVGGFGFVL